MRIGIFVDWTKMPSINMHVEMVQKFAAGLDQIKALPKGLAQGKPKKLALAAAESH